MTTKMCKWWYAAVMVLKQIPRTISAYNKIMNKRFWLNLETRVKNILGSKRDILLYLVHDIIQQGFSISLSCQPVNEMHPKWGAGEILHMVDDTTTIRNCFFPKFRFFCFNFSVFCVFRPLLYKSNIYLARWENTYHY